MYRIGLGYDVHALVPDRELWLGGIKVPHTLGLLGHSDADVLIHAICDAMLGAANLKDIGYHFPDTSSNFKNIDSKILLKECDRLIKEKGYTISNIDSTICAQKPKLKDYIDPMRECLASVLELDPDQVSVKATTTEKLGFVGKEEGIAAQAVVLLKKIKN
jgi:2-C-methyl-D-erythritol 2,4-cyclodiphosphate synthase